MGTPKYDIIGKRFGRLVVLGEAKNPFSNYSLWLCQCDCGKTKEILGLNLVHNRTTSCGCRNIERATKHGHTARNRKSSTYYIYHNMLDRCRNKKNKHYANYGGRGIAVCERWLESFEKFLEDMGERPDNLWIERIDNDGGYSPENCRWATAKEQAYNKRNTRKIVYKGKEYTTQELEELTGISSKKIINRIDYYGWTVERAVEEPLNMSYSRKTVYKLENLH